VGQDRVFRNLACKRIQVDEIWGFVHAKQKNVPTARSAPVNAGDVWLWIATDANTKLVPSWYVDGRDSDSAIIIMDDLASRLANRVQMTTDGHKAYLEAVEGAFGSDIDYAMLVKLYGATPEGTKGRYSPAECTGIRKERIEGNPDPKYVSTSYAERNNLNVRMHSRRLTRLINAFSKKIENHGHAMALHFMYYNFVHIHQTLKMTPAMAAGVTKRLWEIMGIPFTHVAPKASNGGARHHGRLFPERYASITLICSLARLPRRDAAASSSAEYKSDCAGSFR
jgi:IS1 family transposase